MQCLEAIQVGRNEGLAHHLMPGAIPASTISTASLNAIALEFLPANPLGSAEAHDALIAIKSEA